MERDRSKSRDRFRSDYTLDNGKNTMNTNRKAYNLACAAVEEYAHQHPGINLRLEPLNTMINDPHNEHDVQIPIYFSHCDKLRGLETALSDSMGTACYLGFQSPIDHGEIVPQHILHIDSRNVNKPVVPFLNSLWDYFTDMPLYQRAGCGVIVFILLKILLHF